MSILIFISALLFCGACTVPSSFDVLRARTEFLGPEIYHRATWRDIWQSLVPRGDYGKGVGYTKSAFTIGRSEPQTDEEPWQQIQPLNTVGAVSGTAQGAGNLTYNQVYVGHHEDPASPIMIGLMGPMLNQDDLTMYWESQKFWESYFSAMEKRNSRTISNKLGNTFRQYVPKAMCRSSFSFTDGDLSQPVPQAVNLGTVLAAQGAPSSELTQEMLDRTAYLLMQEGAQDGDTNGWITMGEMGPEFPLYIGVEMSNRISLNNSEFRTDLNNSFMGRGDINPVIKRIGARRTIKNFRHIPNLFPARWALMSTGQTINYSSTGPDSNSSVQFTVTCTISAGIATISFTYVGGGTQPYTTPATYTTGAGQGQAFVRIPTFALSNASADATKGLVSKTNGCWIDENIAGYESAEVIHPLVFTQDVLMPVNSLPGAKLNYQNYYGEWEFVTGNDAFLGTPDGVNSCTGITDPMKKRGRHFGEYRFCPSIGINQFGRMLMFKRCASSFDTLSCS